MKVQELMTRNVAICTPEDSLNRAAQLMWEYDCGCVPVVDPSGRVRGMLTDRDICMAAYTQGRSLGNISVQTAMSQEPLSCSPEDSVESAQTLMQKRRVRRVPVTSNGRLAGMLSLSDIVRSTNQRSRSDGVRPEAVVNTLSTIMEPNPMPNASSHPMSAGSRL
jgi:CBS domain-containing protein